MLNEKYTDDMSMIYELLADEAESNYEADLDAMYTATISWRNTVENLDSAE